MRLVLRVKQLRIGKMPDFIVFICIRGNFDCKTPKSVVVAPTRMLAEFESKEINMNWQLWWTWVKNHMRQTTSMNWFVSEARNNVRCTKIKQEFTSAKLLYMQILSCCSTRILTLSVLLAEACGKMSLSGALVIISPHPNHVVMTSERRHVTTGHASWWSISNFSCSLTINTTSHSMKNSAFHRLLGWKMIRLPNYHFLPYTFLFKTVGRMYFLNLGVKGLNVAHLLCGNALFHPAAT